MKLPMLGPDDKLAEIRRLYFTTTSQTIERDISAALDLLKTMASDDERERTTVYMHGLNEMRANWTKKSKSKGPGKDKGKTTRSAKPPAAKRRR